MKKLLAVLLVVVAGIGLAACASTGPAARPSTGGATSAPSAPATVDPYAAIVSDGAHEKAASAAVPSALDTAGKAIKAAGKKVPDLSGATPTLYAVNLSATVGGQLTMFEVRADGAVHGLFAYPAVADPAKLFWQSAANNSGAAVVAPEGTFESAAASAAKAVVDKAKPGKSADIKMSGYAFCFVKGGQPVKTSGGQVFSITVDPKGNAASWVQ